MTIIYFFHSHLLNFVLACIFLITLILKEIIVSMGSMGLMVDLLGYYLIRHHFYIICEALNVLRFYKLRFPCLVYRILIIIHILCFLLAVWLIFLNIVLVQPHLFLLWFIILSLMGALQRFLWEWILFERLLRKVLISIWFPLNWVLHL